MYGKIILHELQCRCYNLRYWWNFGHHLHYWQFWVRSEIVSKLDSYIDLPMVYKIQLTPSKSDFHLSIWTEIMHFSTSKSGFRVSRTKIHGIIESDLHSVHCIWTIEACHRMWCIQSCLYSSSMDNSRTEIWRHSRLLTRRPTVRREKLIPTSSECVNIRGSLEISYEYFHAIKWRPSSRTSSNNTDSILGYRQGNTSPTQVFWQWL